MVIKNLLKSKKGIVMPNKENTLQRLMDFSQKALCIRDKTKGAMDDSKNKRTVFSYLRGSQKDGSANRAGMDFCSQIVMEIEDTGNHITTCIGVVFEVGRSDTELRRYNFFSHSGRIPEDEYLMNGVPYTIDQIKKLAKERSVSVDNRGHGDVNRVYPSKEAYLNIPIMLFGDGSIISHDIALGVG